MKNIFKSTNTLLLCVVLILASCATPNKMACPSFGSSKVVTSKKNRNNVRLSHFNIAHSLKKKHKTKHKKHAISELNNEQLDLTESNEPLNSSTIKPLIGSNTNDTIQSKDDRMEEINHYKSKKINSLLKTKLNVPIQSSEKASAITQDKTESDHHKKVARKEAIIKGVAIILMAIVAGISIPVLGTVTASIGLIAIVLLDVLISILIIRYYKKEKPVLAQTTGFLRLLYSAIFGVGIGYHLLGNVAMFNKFWSLGLITFGIHLIALGILFDNEGGKKWVKYTIKSLLIIAGVGYTLLNIGILLVPNPVAFTALIEPIFIVPQILGEITFALWMIFKGGKNKE